MRPHERTRLAWAVDAAAAALCLFLLQRGRAVMHPDRFSGFVAVTAFAATAAASAVAAAARAAPLRLMPLLLALMAPGLLRAGSAHVVVTAFAAAAFLPVAAMWSVGRSSRWLAGALVCVVLGTAVTRLIYRDPFRELRCGPACVQNPWLRVHAPDLLRSAERALAVVALLWVIAAATTLARRRRPSFDVDAASAVVVLVIAGAWATRLMQQPRPLSGASADRGLTLALFGALAVAAGMRSLGPLQTIAVRRRVRRFATSLSNASDIAAIKAHLRDTTGDLTIDIELGDCSSEESSAVTTVMRDGRVVASIHHSPAARSRVAAAVTPATALALETQLLLRQASEQLDNLKISRATAVLTADDARRRLERDLHDGAQQRLLLVGMRLAHAHEGSPGGTLSVAASHVAAALTDLRRIGRGDAAIIAELGLDDAITAVAGTSPVPTQVTSTPCGDSAHECWPQDVATTAYRLVLGALAAAQSSAAKELTVEVRCLGNGDGRTVATRQNGRTVADRSADHDRVLASDGRIVRDDGYELKVWLP